MATLNFADIKLDEVAPQAKTITYNEQEIEVKQWLPVMDRYNIIMITLQESREGSMYNPIKMDMYLLLNIIYKFTNITFTAEDRVNADETFDKLNTSGLLNAVLKAIPNDTRESLIKGLVETAEKMEKYNSTLAGTIQSIFEIAPDAGEKMNEILNSFDKEKFQEVMEFAKAANGGRDFPIGQN